MKINEYHASKVCVDSSKNKLRGFSSRNQQILLSKKKEFLSNNTMNNKFGKLCKESWNDQNFSIKIVNNLLSYYQCFKGIPY